MREPVLFPQLCGEIQLAASSYRSIRTISATFLLREIRKESILEAEMRHSSSFVTVAASIVAVGLGSVAASAADLAPRYTKAPPPMVVAYNWSGWYVGGNAGWVGSSSNTLTNVGTDQSNGGLGNALNVIGSIPQSFRLRTNGFIGGIQAGYNWQVSNWVFGLEGDFDGVSAKSSATFIFPGSVLSVPLSTNYSRELDWLATFRGRAGIAVAPQFLLYATGGLAVGETKLSNQFVCATCAPPASTQTGTSATNDKTSAGWTAGAGGEWMFAPNWSAKLEYLYVDLGRQRSTITYVYGPGGALVFNSTLTSSVRNTDNIVRVGVNYHFGAPVVAKY
jgi:outer membrane immunogenic protein